uniref:Uncharacterized protein n=1 Tax=Lepeophtheirus salmonis TaxID=72036 RepID=A0A0K2VE67_LEPSM
MELIVRIKILHSLLLLKISLESITLTSFSIHWSERQYVNNFFNNIGPRPIDEINIKMKCNVEDLVKNGNTYQINTDMRKLKKVEMKPKHLVVGNIFHFMFFKQSNET